MNIKHAIYENLAPRQRLIAGIEAIGRKDEAEWQKLRSTCPKRAYKMEDHRFIGAFQALTAEALVVEQLLTSSALSMILFSKAGDDEQAGTHLQDMADVCAAWKEYLQEIGISLDSVNAMMKELRHPVVTFIIDGDPDGLPEPDLEKVKEYRKRWIGNPAARG